MKLRHRRTRRLLTSLPAFLAVVLAAPTSAVAQAPGPFETARAYVTQFYPLWFTFYQSRLSSTNRLIGPDRISPLYQAVVAINDDTLYGSTVMDLSAQPVVLTIPPTPTTYSILTLNQYGDVFPSGIPKQTAGDFLMTGPGYAGPVPSGVTQVRMTSDHFILIFRIDRYSNAGVNQVPEAELFRSMLQMQPLCSYLGAPCPTGVPPGGTTQIVPEAFYAIPFKTIADMMIARDPIAFLLQLQTAVAAPQTPPMSTAERELSVRFDRLFANSSWSSTSEFEAGARAAHQDIVDAYLTNTGPTSWIHFDNIGNWAGNALQRSAITEFIQYGNDIGSAAYYQTFDDARGRPLDGHSPNGYVLHFPAGTLPDAERFWSITAYTPDSIELIRNPEGKYLIARYTPGLHYDQDGSLTIYIAREKPAGVPDANWLPVSDHPFNIMLRVYGVVAGSSVADNTYVPPGIQPGRGRPRGHGRSR